MFKNTTKQNTIKNPNVLPLLSINIADIYTFYTLLLFIIYIIELDKRDAQEWKKCRAGIQV